MKGQHGLSPINTDQKSIGAAEQMCEMFIPAFPDVSFVNIKNIKTVTVKLIFAHLTVRKIKLAAHCELIHLIF